MKTRTRLLFLTKNEIDEWMSYLSTNWGWFLALGIGLCLLGGSAIGVAGFTTWVSTVFLGSVLIVAAVVQIVHAFKFKFGHGFLLNLVVGILSGVAGAMMISRPYVGALSLTALIASYFFASGMFRCVFTASVRYPRWGWGFVAGLVNLAFGAYVMANLPLAAVSLIGVLVGIDMIFNGVAWISLAFAARRYKPQAEEELIPGPTAYPRAS